VQTAERIDHDPGNDPARILLVVGVHRLKDQQQGVAIGGVVQAPPAWPPLMRPAAWASGHILP